jgi:hypothetical protein
MAPANSTIRPCSVNTMSRLKPGISNDSSAPPWYSAPNSRLASTMPAGWLRPISDTAMPAKPAPATKSASSRPCTPASSLMATSPASAPDSIMDRMICCRGAMPA